MTVQHYHYAFMLFFYPLGVNCGLPHEPKNGIISVEGTGKGAIATYSCKPGFVLEPGGDNMRVCSHFGNWTGSVPKCRSK